MFGTFRYVLAALVMVSHLWPAWMHWAGAYAVFAFFLISGYLITLALHHSYGLSAGGCARFVANRCLRIFPPYLVVVFFSGLLLWYMPDIAQAFSPRFHLPTDVLGWAHNVFLFGLQNEPAHIVPAAWSLEIEMAFYLLMAAVLIRYRLITLLWFGSSVALAAIAVAYNYPFEQRYYPLASASLPFSLGALLAIYRTDQMPSVLKTSLAALCFFLNVLAANLTAEPFGAPFYLSLALATYLLIQLAAFDKADMPTWIAAFDGWCGHLSYPVFLLQWPAACAVLALSGWDSLAQNGAYLFFASFILANLGAFILHLSIEQPIAVWRQRIKTKSERLN